MENKQSSLATAEAAAIAAVSTALGFPVPPTLARNVLAATSALVVAAITVPTAWLEGVAMNVKVRAEARAKVTAGSVPAVVEAISTDDELKSRATMYLGGKMLREQANREAVVQQAMDQLRAEAQQKPSEQSDSPGIIDDDWLNIFGKLAESRSDQTMQAYFARILAGEIRRPGSFAPATLEVLSRMTKADAESFRRLCALVAEFWVRVSEGSNDELVFASPCVVAEPYGSPGGNDLAPLGFSYTDLCVLQEAGLIQYDLTAGRTMNPLFFTTFVTRIGKTELRFAQTEQTDASVTRTAKCVHLTRAGGELLRIANVGTNEEYVGKFVDWVEYTFKVRLVSRNATAARGAASE